MTNLYNSLQSCCVDSYRCKSQPHPHSLPLVTNLYNGLHSGSVDSYRCKSEAHPHSLPLVTNLYNGLQSGSVDSYRCKTHPHPHDLPLVTNLYNGLQSGSVDSYRCKTHPHPHSLLLVSTRCWGNSCLVPHSSCHSNRNALTGVGLVPMDTHSLVPALVAGVTRVQLSACVTRVSGHAYRLVAIMCFLTSSFVLTSTEICKICSIIFRELLTDWMYNLLLLKLLP